MGNPLKNKQSKFLEIPESSSIRSIRYLTLQGGGMKGIGFVGVVKSLEETGVLAQLEEVAGTSAGALAAALIAVGCSAEEIKQEMLTLNFKQFQDPETPGWVETLHLNNLNPLNVAKQFSSTTHKVEAIKQSLGDQGSEDNVAPDNIAAHPKAHNPSSEKAPDPLYHGALDLAEKASQVYFNLGLWQGDALSNWVSSIVARKTGNPNITFAELAALTKQSLSPFKKLNLTGSNLTDKKLEYYNATLTPDMSIVDAVRISASFPGAFKPVIRYENGVKKILVDGGLLENLPDVFNKAPYINKDNFSEDSGNKESLAIVFKDPKESKPSVIKNGLDLAKAMYASKMSDSAMYERYGENIAHIDPMGVDTLEFGASDTKRHNLAMSGAKSVMQTFHKILQKEEQETEQVLPKLSSEALIRLKTAYQFELIKKKDVKQILNKLVLLNQEIEKRKLSPGIVQQLKQQFEQRILQRQKKIQSALLTDHELSLAYQDSLKLYRHTDLELHNRLQHLKLARRALILRREEVIHEFEQDKHKNSFQESLTTLNNLQTKILQNRQQFAEAEQAIEHGTVGSAGKADLLEKIAKEYDQLIQMRDEFFRSMQLHHKTHGVNNQIYTDFFKELHYHCMQNITFEIPTSSKSLRDYYENDIKYCGMLIREGKLEKNKAEKEQHLFQKYEKLFNEKTERSSPYAKLVHFKRELDESILRKTTFLGKINHYLIKKGPTFKRIINPFLKLASFTAFMCSLPLAIPAVPIAKAIKYFSKDEGTKSSASRFINFFKYVNIDYDSKLRGFQKTTTDFLHVMKKNYTHDKSESSYIQRIFSEHLKNSGLKLKDVLIKQDEESPEMYHQRIEDVKKKLEIPMLISVDLASEPEVASEPKIELENKVSDEAAEARFQALKAKLDRENTLLIHAEFMHNIKDKIHLKQPLSKQEVNEYVASTKALQLPLSKKFAEHYQHLIQKAPLQDKKTHLLNHKQYREGKKEQEALDVFMKEKLNDHSVQDSSAPTPTHMRRRHDNKHQKQ